MFLDADTPPGQFCWVDLAATDADQAKDFYGRLFGWTHREQPANGGHFTRLQLAGRDVASLYQLKRAHLEHGVPSHWTPYVRVDDVDATVQRVVRLGGKVIIQPFPVEGVARVALILDPGGAHLGLWQAATDEELETLYRQ